MSTWVKAGKIDEFAEGRMIRIDLDDEDLIVIHKGSEFYCFSDMCSHMDVPLSRGSLEDDVVVCRAHGAKFDVASGKALCMPATSPLTKFATKVEDGCLWIDLDGV